MNSKAGAILLAAAMVTVGAQAQEIMVSWESNGVLMASGMVPGDAFQLKRR